MTFRAPSILGALIGVALATMGLAGVAERLFERRAHDRGASGTRRR